MEEILKKLQEMDKKLDKIDSVDSKLEQTLKMVDELRTENQKLQNQVKEQEERILHMEREMNKKYVIMYGLKEEQEETETCVNGKVIQVIEQLGISLDAKDLQECRRLGKQENGKNRPLLIELSQMRIRSQILKNKKLLRTKQNEIWLDEMYPNKVMQQRKELVRIMKNERENGNEAYIRYDKLIINGKVYPHIHTQAAHTITHKNTPIQYTIGPKTRTFSQRSPEETEQVWQREKIRNIARTCQKN